MAEHFKITNLSTLETRNVPLDELSRNLLLNSVIQDADGLHVGLVTRQDLVFFARTWAGEVLDAAGEKPPAAVEALLLVDRWLLDTKSVSREELDAAAEAAWAAEAAARAAEAAGAEAAGAAEAAARAAEAAGAAGAAAWAAEAAARAAEAAGAAGAAAWAAGAAARAAVAAVAARAAATWAAAGAVGAAGAAARAAAYKKQGEFIIEHLRRS